MSFPAFPVSFPWIFYPSSRLCFFLVYPFGTYECSHSVPMSVPFSTNECSIQCKWEAHSVPMRPSFTTSCRYPSKDTRLDTSLTPSWHLLDTSLWYKRHRYSLLHYGLTPWHLKSNKYLESLILLPGLSVGDLIIKWQKATQFLTQCNILINLSFSICTIDGELWTSLLVLAFLPSMGECCVHISL